MSIIGILFDYNLFFISVHMNHELKIVIWQYKPKHYYWLNQHKSFQNYQQHFLMNEQVCFIYVFVWEKRVKDGFIFISDNHFWLQSSIFYPSSIRCSSSAPMFVLAPTNCCWLHSYSMAIFIFSELFPKP